jgi:hypothetical protein
MVFLSVAVAVLAGLVLIDLVLSAAVIRRLRDTEQQLIEIMTPPETGMTPGEPMPDFVLPGGEFSRADLTGRPALVAFFSASCRHCPAQAERLAERADELADKGVAVVSVLSASDGAADDLSPLLRKAGRLVGENGAGELMRAFHAEHTPTFLMFDRAGLLLANGHGLDEVLGGK